MLLDLTAIARKDYEHSRRVCQPFFAPPCPGRRNPKVPSPRDMVAGLFFRSGLFQLTAISTRLALVSAAENHDLLASSNLP